MTMIDFSTAHIRERGEGKSFVNYKFRVIGVVSRSLTSRANRATCLGGNNWMFDGSFPSYMLFAVNFLLGWRPHLRTNRTI